jgi:hypothetical protein
MAPSAMSAFIYGGRRFLGNVAQTQRTPRPVQGQLPDTAHAEFVICDCTIEEAYLVVKRLLGLAYFSCSAINAIQVQLWATWILYAVLIDLTDAVAEELRQPFAMISVEMVYRGLYHFSQAYKRGDASDPVVYLAKKASVLDIIKAKRPKSLDAVALLTNQLKA